MDGKLLRGNIRGMVDFGSTDLTGLFLKSGQDDHISRVQDEELEQVLRVIRYQA